ncbi:hypothetical protein GCM10029992_12710 [Glycomyces albus]
MKYRRWVAKVALALMLVGVGTFGATVPASPAVAADCNLTTSVSTPKKTQSRVYVVFHVNISNCAGKYWTEYSNIAGPGASDNGRTVTYRGNRSYSLFMTVSCRTGRYNAYLQVIGEGFNAFRESTNYIRC